MRNLVTASFVVTALVTNSFAATFAAPHVLKASAVPEPGVLVALGGGLVGLATFVRRRFSR